MKPVGRNLLWLLFLAGCACHTIPGLEDNTGWFPINCKNPPRTTLYEAEGLTATQQGDHFHLDADCQVADCTLVCADGTCEVVAE